MAKQTWAGLEMPFRMKGLHLPCQEAYRPCYPCLPFHPYRTVTIEMMKQKVVVVRTCRLVELLPCRLRHHNRSIHRRNRLRIVNRLAFCFPSWMVAISSWNCRLDCYFWEYLPILNLTCLFKFKNYQISSQAQTSISCTFQSVAFPAKY